MPTRTPATRIRNGHLELRRFEPWIFAGRLCGGIAHATLASSRWSTQKPSLKIKSTTSTN